MFPVRWSLRVVLCTALLVAWPGPAAAAAVDQLARDLGRLESLLEQARFREAAQRAPLLRAQALSLPPSDDARRLAVRADVVAGTAALALRQEVAARQCFRRALQLDPRLTLAPGTPPKVRRTFDAARGGGR
jgi:hypothetical protein